MNPDLPPDPYAALGVSKEADADTIKKTYRKLVLKCHPDKVTDESLKQQKQEEFHKIQQAYEIIGDEEKRGKYDAEVHLEKLRKESRAKNGGRPDVEIRTTQAHYETRTAAPAGASFRTTTAPRYEERKPSRAYDDDRHRAERSSSSKYDTYDAYPKQRTSTRTSRPEKETPTKARVSSDRTRSDHKKSREKEERRDRSNKFVHVSDESSSERDEKLRYEAEFRKRTEDARRQADDEEARRAAAEARRRADERRPAEEPRRHRSDDRDSYEYDRYRKERDQHSEAMSYIHRSKAEAERPSVSRTSSSRDVPREYARRPEPVRRSSARPKDSRPSSSGRDRDRVPQIVEWDEPRPERRVPSFQHSVSSPPELQVPRATPQRSYTDTSRDHRSRTETSPTPVFRRSETMPHSSSSSSRRSKEATPVQPSKLRSSETIHDSGYSSPDSPDHYATVTQSGEKRKVYHYPTPGGGVKLSPEDIVGVANNHRTVLREPERHRARSPSPLSRPPIGANRPADASSVRYQRAPAPPISTPHTVPPPLMRSNTVNVSPVHGEERGRQRMYYGEIPSDYTKRENARRQTSFSPDQIQYAKRIVPEDVRFSSRDRSEKDHPYKPTLGRQSTSVY